MPNGFYMVYLEGGRTPAYKHESQESAEAEARRLAEAHNKTAFVLKTVKSVACNKFIEQDLDPDILW